MYFTAYTLKRGVPRTFLIELKENDLEKVILQAYQRYKLAHYTYIIINHSPEYIFDYTIRKWDTLARAIAISGIGIISYKIDLDQPPILLRKAKYNHYNTVQEHLRALSNGCKHELGYRIHNKKKYERHKINKIRRKEWIPYA